MQPSVESTYASAPVLFPQTLQNMARKNPELIVIEEPDRDSLFVPSV